jgi:hypothetical protein
MSLSYLINVQVLVFFSPSYLCELSEELSICVLHRLAFVLFIRDRHRFHPQGERRGRRDWCVGKFVSLPNVRARDVQVRIRLWHFDGGTAAFRKRATREPEPVAQRVLRP